MAADREQLYKALRAADAAGDADGARKLAAYIRGLPADAAAPAPEKPAGGGVAQTLGNVGAGLVRGAGSIGATLLAPVDIASDALAGRPLMQSNRERRAGIDGGLESLGAQPDSFAYGAGKLAGELAGTAGVGGVLGAGAKALGATPGVVQALTTSGFAGGNPLARAAGGTVTGGASAGLVDPEQAAIGAVLGGVAPGVLQAAGGAGRALGRAMSPRVNNPALAQRALDAGIPLGLSDISGNPMMRAARSVLDDAPFTGATGQARREAVQGGFNRAVGGTFGAPSPSLTPQVLDAAKQRMGGEFDRIWGSNSLTVDQALDGQLRSLEQAAKKLPRSEGASLQAEVRDLWSRATLDPATGSLTIPGDVANKFQQYLRRRAESTPGLKYELGDLRQNIIQAFNRSVSPTDAAALTMNRSQYKAFKTVEPLLNGAEAGVAGRAAGDVPAGLLPQAVRQSYGANVAGSPLGDLSQIGSQYVADRVARTGGSARAAIQNSLLGATLATNPLAALLAAPVAVGAQKALTSTSLARKALSPGQANALQQLLENPELQQAILRGAPVVATDR